jgi:hypothetical protein
MYYKFPSDKRMAARAPGRDETPFDQNARHVARVTDVAMEA